MEQVGSCPRPVGMGPVETGLEIPAESTGMEMGTLMEYQTESGKTDQGASQDGVSSWEGGMLERVV